MKHSRIDNLEPFPWGTMVKSSWSNERYELLQQIGEGGFGTVWLAQGLDPDTRKLGRVCIKLLRDQSSWHAEAFYGKLLRGNHRVVHLYESFPYTVQAGGYLDQWFALVYEFAKLGDLSHYLQARGAWPEERAIREVLALLGVLEQLHAVGVVHRDLTPRNILVDKGGRLILADFGIAALGLTGKGVPANMRNPCFVTKGHHAFRHKKWTTQDDVYQLGQVLAMMLSGTSEMLTRRQIRRVACSDRTKDVILTATGTRGKRYAHVSTMREALVGRATPPPIRSLEGKKVAITGLFSKKQSEIILRIKQAGGLFQSKVHPNTDVIVVGGPSPMYPGRKREGGKLKNQARLARDGHDIPILSEMEFLKVVRRPGRGKQSG